MAVAEAVVSFVVERIGDFIIQKGEFLAGVSDQFREARDDLCIMRGYLKSAEARQENEVVRIWVAKVRDAAYDLEDAIEIYALKVASKRGGGSPKNFFKRYLLKAPHIYQFGSEFRSISNRISKLRSSVDKFKLVTGESGGYTSLQLSEQHKLRRTYSHFTEPHFVGCEDSVTELVKYLVGDASDEGFHGVASIWGMAGLGKTTLAREVYRHSEVRSHFTYFAWMCISHQCQQREVWEGILVKLISPTEEVKREIRASSNDEIVKKLYTVQQESKCLVVLDDIWTADTLDSLKNAFPLNVQTKSRILLTTRNRSVASHFQNRNGFLLKLQPLKDHESWQLLEKIAIDRRDDADFKFDEKMKELGKTMLKHCAGLPLAIKVLSGLLHSKNTIDEWETVCNNAYSIRGEGNYEQEYARDARAFSVLMLSYHDLPFHLRPCFLYLGNFPMDSEISVTTLTHLWIAEGLISLPQRRQDLEMEDVAYGYLKDLVDRCLVQVGEWGSVGKIKTCRIHDLMRHLCISKAEEENFFHIVNFLHGNEEVYDPSFIITNKAPVDKVRRLSMYLGENADRLAPSRDERNGHLRSLLYFSPGKSMPRSNDLLRSLFKHFKLLRVLKFEGMAEAIELPSEIGKMVHLRFLSLRDSVIKQLPLTMGNLICLQTLDFRFRNSEIVPNVLWKMKQLRHLYLPNKYTVNGKLQLSTLHSLQTLLHVSSRDCDLRDLTQLKKLRKLCIRLSSPLNNLEEILESIRSTLGRIQSLFVDNLDGINSPAEATKIILNCSQIHKLDLSGRTVESPKDIQYHRNLTKLSLYHTLLKDEHLEILEKLPKLRILSLKRGAFDANTLVCSRESFPYLEYLSLIELEIENWRMDEGAMPRLCRMHITRCERLKTVPDGLKCIATLKELTITDMPQRFYGRLQKGGRDFYKVKHVPSLVFGKPLN